MEQTVWTDERLDDRFNGIDRRFDEVDRRFDEVDRRLDGVDRRLDGVDRRLDRVAGEIGELRRLTFQLWGTNMLAILITLVALIVTRA